jgi:hypothetical protein
MRLNLIVEGQTEQVFAQKVLQPHLAPRRVYLSKPRLTAFSKSKGMVRRGGARKYVTLRNDILRWLSEDRHADVRFSTMIDLYQLPRDFPEYDDAKKLADPYQRVAKLEQAFQDDIGDRRFIAHLQLHEFEALLLSEPGRFIDYYPDNQREVESLGQLVERFRNPEWIDDGEQTAPSKRIADLFPQYPGVKRTAGPIIAAEIGLQTMRAKCPHFNQWVTNLEGLAAR